MRSTSTLAAEGVRGASIGTTGDQGDTLARAVLTPTPSTAKA